MMSRHLSNAAAFVFAAVAFIAGYMFLRLAYRVSDTMPFSQEFVLVILGTLTTVVITGLLLHKQSDFELSKDLSIKYIDLKSQIYLELISDIENLVGAQRLSARELNHLEFLTHKIALVGAPEVLKAYGVFLAKISKAVKDKDISEADSELVSRQLGQLSIALRHDLLAHMNGDGDQLDDEVHRQIVTNSQQSIETF